jgi:cadmium resistance protein CadD (predicted permease)
MAELTNSYWQKRGNFHPFSLKCHIPVSIYKSWRRSGKFLKSSAVLLLCLLFPIRLFLAKLKLVRQFLQETFCIIFLRMCLVCAVKEKEKESKDWQTLCCQRQKQQHVCNVHTIHFVNRKKRTE